MKNIDKDNINKKEKEKDNINKKEKDKILKMIENIEEEYNYKTIDDLLKN